MRHVLNGDILTIFLEGELNSYNAESIGAEIDGIIKGKSFKNLVLDLEITCQLSMLL